MAGEKGPIPWQEEQSLSAGVVRDLRAAVYVPPANQTTYGICQVEASSKAFAIPPVSGSSEPRPQGMQVYRDDAYHIAFGAGTQGPANVYPFFRTVCDSLGGYVPGGIQWYFPLHPNTDTVFVFATVNTSLLRANWVYQK